MSLWTGDERIESIAPLGSKISSSVQRSSTMTFLKTLLFENEFKRSVSRQMLSALIIWETARLDQLFPWAARTVENSSRRAAIVLCFLSEATISKMAFVIAMLAWWNVPTSTRQRRRVDDMHVVESEF